MLDDLNRTLIAVLARTMEFDAKLSSDDAVGRVVHLAAEAGLPNFEPHLRALVSKFSQRGVINPRWLMKDGTRPFFFLANGRPGLFGQVLSDSRSTRTGVSQYVVYGHWDTLLVLYGSAQEAANLLTRMQEGAYEDTVQFVAQEVLLAQRHRVPPGFRPVKEVTAEDINNVALRYEDGESGSLRSALLASQVLLGPTLTRENESPYPVTAFVGINVRSRSAISNAEVLDALMDQEDLKLCMIDLFQIDQGIPFRYFAKISCASVGELDAATNAIAFASRGGMRFEGETLVVAHSSEQPPLARKPDLTSLAITPDTGPMARAAERVFADLTEEQRLSFNGLPDERQLAVLRAFAGLQATLGDSTLDGATREHIVSAIRAFAGEATKSEGAPNLTGAVVEIATTVEGSAKQLLSRIAYSVCGNDQGAIQRELRLPSRKIRGLSLGKVVQAFQTAAEHDLFEPVRPHIPEEWVERLSGFSDTRNRWAHGAVTGTRSQLIDEAFLAMREGISIAGWLSGELAIVLARREAMAPGQPVEDDEEADEQSVQLKLPARADPTDFRVFVSHATADGPIAERLASGLQALGYGSWFAEWELLGGDSIIRKIETALAACDVLLVVLSSRSIASEWVQRELNAVLMAQLSGQNVRVIPVLIDDCDIPELLRDIKHIDLRNRFEEGFLELLDSLRQHRAEINRAPRRRAPAPRRPAEDQARLRNTD